MPDTAETRYVERQELFRLALTQAMRQIRTKAGLTQEQLAERLGVEQSWIYTLESANHEHTFESVIAYLNVLGAKLELSLILAGEIISVSQENSLLDTSGF